MRRTINNIVSVLFTLFKFSVMKLFHWNSFHFSLIERFSPNVVIELNRGGRAILGKMVRVHSGSKIKVRTEGVLRIDSNVKINYNCIIVCRKSIVIGEGTEFGPSVYVYDHDHDYRVGLKQNKFRSTPIKIGKNCWIGANAILLRGTEIGDNSVVGAGTVVKGCYPPNSVIMNEKK